ncbi:MAG: hypothetical protein D6805_02535 [Planctomycetota bacterium]|nr:MAG: hypothetical protein D6805_02535 [Planctomycetota bacterium]
MPYMPDPIVKREIVYGKRTWNCPIEELGDRAKKAGNLWDALLYYQRAQAEEKILSLASTAVEEGNAFLLDQIGHFAELAQTLENWQKLKENAQKKGKIAYVQWAEEKLKHLQNE